MAKTNVMTKHFLNKNSNNTYLNTPFIVPRIKLRLKKIVSNLVPIKYMYKRGTKPETFFFKFDFIPGTKNGVLRYFYTRVEIYVLKCV